MKIDEFTLINRIKSKGLNINGDVVVGIGDDAAVLEFDRTSYQVITVDTLVEDVHFKKDWITPQQFGYKAAAVSLSDIAAMGATPTYALFSLMIPPDVDANFVEKVYDGIYKLCSRYRVQVVGGNIARSEKLIIDSILMGNVKRNRLLTRSGAKVGDVVAVTGNLGSAAGGLQILQDLKVNLTAKEKKILTTAQLSPSPRIDEAQITASYGATAMIDLSDGLSSDLLHICNTSDVGVIIEAVKLPSIGALRKIASQIGRETWEIAVSGGEDYELCFTVSQKSFDRVQRAVQKTTGTLVTRVGEILSKEEGRWIEFPDGKKAALHARGWKHF
jgi:thiamine-monophosphate kinase